MTKELQNKWSEAFKVTLKEYEENRHNIGDCKLCALRKGSDCEFCPMSVFERAMYTMSIFERAMYTGCSQRKCSFRDSGDSKITNIDIQRVIAFYKEAIKLWDSLDVEEYKTFDRYTETEWSKKIKLTDEAVYERIGQLMGEE